MKHNRFTGKKARQLIVVCAVAAGMGLPKDAAAAADNSVQSVVEHTINGNPEVQAKWHEFRAANYEEDVAYGGYFPKLDASAGIGREWVDGENLTKDVYTRKGVRLELKQMLFDGLYTHHQAVSYTHLRAHET